MTLTTKDSPDLNASAKPGAPSQNSGNKAGQSPRSNPVCLEVGVTIRSLPNQAGGPTQPIREEARTVIVFDNGAVLRSTNNMPEGLTVILSNANGRDVVCRVVGGRNMPSIKGYVEVEFIEPVNDFWSIHQDGAPVPAAAPPAPQFAPPEAPAAPPPAPPRAIRSQEAPAKPSSVVLGSGPKVDDIPGPTSTPTSSALRESKTPSTRLGPERIAPEISGYNLSEDAGPTSLANWDSTPAEPPVDKRAISAMRDSLSNSTQTPARGFMSKGLMAYEQPGSSSRASNGNMPLILGAAAVVLAVVGAAVFVLRRPSAPAPAMNMSALTRPSAVLPSVENLSPAVTTPPDATTPTATEAQPTALPVSVEQSQPAAAVTPVPAVVAGPAPAEIRLESRPEPRPVSRNVRRPEKSAVVAKQPEPAPARRPAIPNLKMGSPSAPNQNPGNPSDGAAPLTDVASTEVAGAVTPAGLLTSSGRTSNPPTPPSAPAPVVSAPSAAVKTVLPAKLISSTRPVYPPTAKESGIQGTVTVSASIDATGKIVDAKALTGPMVLRQAALDSVQKWKYSPAQEDGKPTPSRVNVSVEFRLN